MRRTCSRRVTATVTRLLYFFYDNSADPASGHFTVNGVVQAANTTFAVNAAQLAQTTFTAGSRVSDDLFVNAWDGIDLQRAAGVPRQRSGEPRADGDGIRPVRRRRGQVFTASSLFSGERCATATACCTSSTTTARIPRAATSPSTAWIQAANTTFAVERGAAGADHFHRRSRLSDDLFVNAWDGIALQRAAGVPRQRSGEPGADGDGAGFLGVEGTGRSPHRRCSRPTTPMATSLLYFFYDNSAALDERPLHRQRRGAGRGHDLRGAARAAGADHFHGRDTRARTTCS